MTPRGTTRSSFQALPTQLRLMLSYPRVPFRQMPSHQRPSLFGCD